jgi:hypothetical protein
VVLTIISHGLSIFTRLKTLCHIKLKVKYLFIHRSKFIEVYVYVFHVTHYYYYSEHFVYIDHIRVSSATEKL